MILEKERLRELVDADVHATTFVPLHVDRIREYKGSLQVTESGYNVGVRTEVEPYGDDWRLREGTYRVDFEETVDLDPYEQLPIILPSSNALSVGVEATVRYVTDGNLWTLLTVNKSVEVTENAVLALLIINENESEDVLTLDDTLEETHEISGEGTSIEFETGE